MKKSEIEVGGNYLAKVGARTVEVRIIGEHARGGWDATSVATGKPVRVKDARRLKPAKAPAHAQVPAQPAPEATTAAKAEAGPADADPDPAPPTKPAKGPGREAKRRPETADVAAPKRMSCLDAAAAVLKATGGPMRCGDMVAAMRDQGLWTTTAPTPAASAASAASKTSAGLQLDAVGTVQALRRHPRQLQRARHLVRRDAGVEHDTDEAGAGVREGWRGREVERRGAVWRCEAAHGSVSC